MRAIEEIYVIDGTKRTPTIKFNKKDGELSIIGKSLPEYSYGFYGKIIDEVDEYMEDARDLTTLDLKLDYLNTVSSKLIMHILLRFEKLLDEGKQVQIKWHYNADDDMMKEMGEVYQSSTRIPIQLIQDED